MTPPRKLLTVLCAGALAGGVVVALLLRGDVLRDGATPVLQHGARDAAAPSFSSGDARPAPGTADASAEALVPSPAHLAVRLPPGVRPAGEVLVSLTSESIALGSERSVSPEAVWDDLAPGPWQLAVSSPGWAVPEAQLVLGPGASATVELVPLSLVEGHVVGARSGRLFEDLRQFVVIGRDAAAQSKPPARALFASELHLPGGAFRIGGLDVSDVDTVRFSAAVADEEPQFTEWLPASSRPIWSGVVVPLAELVVRGRISAAEPPNAALGNAQVLLVPPDVELGDVRLAGVDLYLAPNERGQMQRGVFDVARTNESGEFALRTSVRVTEARVLACTPGRLPALSPVVALPLDAEPAQVDLALGRGSEVRVLVHVPARSTGGDEPSVDEEPRRITLEVVEDGQPVRSAALTEWLKRRDGALPGELDYEATFDSVAPGDYLACVLLMPPERNDRGRLLRRALRIAEDAPALVELRADEPSPGVTLRGRIVLPPGFELGTSEVTLVRRGAPIDGATLPQAMGRLLPDGHFELPGVVPGDQALLVIARSAGLEGLALGYALVDVGDGAPAELLLDLTTPEIRVRAKGPEARKFTLASATADSELDALLALDYIGAVVPAGSGSEARLCGLPPGHYSLRPADGSQPVELDVGAGSQAIALD